MWFMRKLQPFLLIIHLGLRSGDAPFFKSNPTLNYPFERTHSLLPSEWGLTDELG